jgi:CARDB
MRQWKLYPTVITGLFLLFYATLAACSQPTPAVENTPVLKPAEFEVGPITIEPPVVMAGDSATVMTTVKNIGDIAGTYTAELFIAGKEVESKTVSVNPAETQEISFQLQETNAGSHPLTIGNSGTVLTVYNWTPQTIQYDESDGVDIGIYVSGDNGHITRFTPPNKAFKIQKIKIYQRVHFLNISDLDKNHLTVRIWDKDGNNKLWSQDFPWRVFWESNGWRELKVPDVRVNDDFNVEIVTHSNPMAYIQGTEIPSPGGDSINDLKIYRSGASGMGTLNVILIGFEYPTSYSSSPSTRAVTRSGYSYMGKLIDPGQGRLQGINWLIRVDGEGAPED